MYTYYQNTHTYYQNTHTIVKNTHKLQHNLQQKQYLIHTKWISHNTIKYTQYKVTILNMVLFFPRTSP